ncbi:LysR family transcriptional regulator [Shimia sagamensis]|uniref:Regulatory helix-turn-helix protein, lysR family n=1 Tax=Shimia sagamensis TaxID=1566352 RepID=A0ABY1NH85_9RHOB|nr:LysR family transcriptional regulator [Shimia sagamensis]SMP09694.1 regulatory helix-turn-helix protein, lysR family [Shimia sagamensis]
MTYRLPPLNSLKAFEAAARNRSFKAAASELGVTSGAVSQLVKKLELALSIELFTRFTNGLILTPDGEKYFHRIAGIFELLTDATDEVAPDHNGRKFSVGLCSELYDLLPKGWARSTNGLRHAVRDVVHDADPALVWNGELDCIVRINGDSVDDLCSREILERHKEPSGRKVVLQSKPALVNCHQTNEIAASIRELLINSQQEVG